MEEEKQFTQKESANSTDNKSGVSQEEKNIALLSYLFLLFLIPLLLKRDSDFAQFHARQGLVLAIAWFVAMIFGMIPFLGILLWLFCLVLSIMGIVNALSGQKKELPLIGKYAEQFKI